MKRVLNYLIAFIVLAGILLANGCAIETENQLQISTDEPKATETQVIPTETEVPAYVVNDSTEAFTPVQETINQSAEVVAQKERIQRWLDYWVQFDNRPFALDSADIHWKYIYDDPAEPQEAVVLIEVGGPDYKNKLFGVPMNEEGFVDFPPPVTGTSIQPGLGPLEINPNKDNTQLSIDQGDLVRLSPEGKIVERLVTGHWEAESLIKGNIFQDPQSKAEFDTVVLAPSPIDDPENFALFQEEYLQKINEQAETYRDQAIDPQFEISGDGLYLFHASVWKPVASYKFKWAGQEILNKTFLYTSRQGDLVPITLTYATEDSRFFDEEFSYRIPDGSQKMDLYVLYTFDERRQKKYPGDFIGQFLPTDTSPELKEAIARIWWDGNGIPTQADYEMLSKMPLILWSFEEH